MSESNLRVETFWIAWLGIDDLPVDVHWVFVLEGWEASQHLVDQDSKSPPVYWLAMALIQENLRSDVLRSTTNRVCPFSHYLRKPKVNQLQVTILGYHDVLRL